jgi:hypothetical protein
MPDDSDGEGRLFFADAAGLFAEAHGERPGEPVFHHPMAARVGKHRGGGFGQLVAEIKADIGGGFFSVDARSGEAQDAAESRPSVLVLQSGDSAGHVTAACLDAALAFVGFLVPVEWRVLGRRLQDSRPSSGSVP